MPFVDLNVSVQISPEQEHSLKAEMARIVETIFGKSEKSLMLRFQDNCRMWCRGANDKAVAFVHVHLYGSSGNIDNEAFGLAVMELLENELGIGHKEVFIKLVEDQNWFWA